MVTQYVQIGHQYKEEYYRLYNDTILSYANTSESEISILKHELQDFFLWGLVLFS